MISSIHQCEVILKLIFFSFHYNRKRCMIFCLQPGLIAAQDDNIKPSNQSITPFPPLNKDILVFFSISRKLLKCICCKEFFLAGESNSRPRLILYHHGGLEWQPREYKEFYYIAGMGSSIIMLDMSRCLRSFLCCVLRALRWLHCR